MKLIGAVTSPYVRKVRIVMAEKKLDYQFVSEDVWSAGTRIGESNPLGKVPCLVMEGGEYYESYLRDSPQATDRASVEAAIAEERLKLPTARAAKSDSGAEGAPFYKKWWFWTASGAAVVALGVGLGVGLSRPTTASYREVTWQ